MITRNILLIERKRVGEKKREMEREKRVRKREMTLRVVKLINCSQRVTMIKEKLHLVCLFTHSLEISKTVYWFILVLRSSFFTPLYFSKTCRYLQKKQFKTVESSD